MRIDAYNAVSQIYKTSSYSKNNKVVTNDVKARIQAGTYNISSEDVADKILDRISTLTF